MAEKRELRVHCPECGLHGMHLKHCSIGKSKALIAEAAKNVDWGRIEKSEVNQECPECGMIEHSKDCNHKEISRILFNDIEYKEDQRVFKSRIPKTNEDITAIFEKSLATMLKVNEERGDAWRAVGMLGSFLEVRTMYLRLRNLMWMRDTPAHEGQYEKWKADCINALEDLRNYTMLTELCLMENNLKGTGDDSEF